MSRKGSVGYVQEEGIEGTRARAYTRFTNESIRGARKGERHPKEMLEAMCLCVMTARAE